LNSGNYSEAEHHLIESYTGLQASSKNESDSIQKTLTALVELYKILGRKEKAEFYSQMIIN
jgi:hypothetical protein